LLILFVDFHSDIVYQRQYEEVDDVGVVVVVALDLELER
jgi:hypothetical protein